jgi:hypothetical protein
MTEIFLKINKIICNSINLLYPLLSEFSQNLKRFTHRCDIYGILMLFF